MTAALALAAEHDAAGRHDDAINELARAAQAGDADAMTELGKRLITGDRAPQLPRDGAGLLADAMQAGSAEAALRLAVMSALGAYREQSWGQALALLVHAAEQGSALARGQIYVLARRKEPGKPETPSPQKAETPGSAPSRQTPEKPGPAPSGPPAPSAPSRAPSWRELAESIDLGAWLAPAAGVTLHDRPTVRCFADFVTDEACDWLMARARGRLKRALIYDPASGGDVADQMRTNSAAGFDLMDVDLVQILIQQRMAAAVGLHVHHLEGPMVLHYKTGEQITEHFDFVNPKMPGYADEISRRGERIITFLVYLNDDYAGGETEFPQLGVRHKARRRDALFFTNALPSGQPDPRMVHAGRPPTAGEKWIVSQFIRNRPALNARAERLD